MSKTYAWPWQNPSYPEDRDMTVDEMEAYARAASLARAQSPNPLVCKIDGLWSLDDPFHAHDFNTCMSYRHAHVVGEALHRARGLLREFDGGACPLRGGCREATGRRNADSFAQHVAPNFLTAQVVHTHLRSSKT